MLSIPPSLHAAACLFVARSIAQSPTESEEVEYSSEDFNKMFFHQNSKETSKDEIEMVISEVINNLSYFMENQTQYKHAKEKFALKKVNL